MFLRWIITRHLTLTTQACTDCAPYLLLWPQAILTFNLETLIISTTITTLSLTTTGHQPIWITDLQTLEGFRGTWAHPSSTGMKTSGARIQIQMVEVLAGWTHQAMWQATCTKSQWSMKWMKQASTMSTNWVSITRLRRKLRGIEVKLKRSFDHPTWAPTQPKTAEKIWLSTETSNSTWLIIHRLYIRTTRSSFLTKRFLTWL